MLGTFGIIQSTATFSLARKQGGSFLEEFALGMYLVLQYPDICEYNIKLVPS
jgi:hypothetical protein